MAKREIRRGLEKSLELYYRSLRKFLPPDDQILRELIREAQSGSKDALDALLLRNQPLVLKIARKIYYKICMRLGDLADIMDLVQIGTIGLRKAVMKFDPKSDRQFVPSAYIWVTYEIYNNIQEEYFEILSQPQHLHELDNSWRYLNWHKKELGIEWDEPLSFFKGMALSEIQKEAHHSFTSKSLQSNICGNGDGDGDGRPYDEIVADQHCESPEEQASVLEFSDLLKKLICVVDLDDREKYIIFARFGIVDGKCRTLEEIGQAINLNKSSVCQLEKNAIRKLQQASGFLLSAELLAD